MVKDKCKQFARIIVLTCMVFILCSLDISVAQESVEIDYTLTNKTLTIHKLSDSTTQVILPTSNMGAIDKIILESSAGSKTITSLKLIANEEIIVEKSAFYGCSNLKEIDLVAADKITLGGEGWNLNDRDNYGCFENSGVEKVAIKTKELDLSDGWIFYKCSNFSNFECNVEISHIGENCFSDNYWTKDGYVYWNPWILNSEKGYICVGDTTVAYTGEEECVTLPTGKVSLDLFNGNINIKSLIMPNNLTEIPHDGKYRSIFTGLESVETIKLSEKIVEIPSFCFYNCSSLKHIEIPEQVTFISACAFAFCENLETLIIPRNAWLVDHQIGVNTMFAECHNLVLKVYEESPGEEFVKNSIDNVMCDVIPKIELQDNAIRLATQVQLGIAGDLYETDLEEITSLNVRGARTLSDIALFTNLETLKANFGWIDDVSALKQLENLKKLDLSFNRLTDITPLKEIKNLEDVNLQGNMIADATPVEHVKNVILIHNYIEDELPWIRKGENKAEIGIIDFGGQWYYAIYYDSTMIKNGTLDVGESIHRICTIKYPKVENPELIEIKLFLWEKDGSIQPYGVLGYWELPVISSEYCN